MAEICGLNCWQCPVKEEQKLSCGVRICVGLLGKMRTSLEGISQKLDIIAEAGINNDSEVMEEIRESVAMIRKSVSECPYPIEEEEETAAKVEVTNQKKTNPDDEDPE